MATSERLTRIHIFVDHSNIWGGARGASRLKAPKIPDLSARGSVRHLHRILGGERQGVSIKIVAGGIPPGMEGVWAEYQHYGYDTHRLVRDDNWKEQGVDHTIIGHIWRLLAKYPDAPTLLVLASGDGHQNELGTSFLEVLEEILDRDKHHTWEVHLASFDWDYPNDARLRSPTSSKMKRLIEKKPARAKFINLFDAYDKVVYHKEWTPLKPGTV